MCLDRGVVDSGSWFWRWPWTLAWGVETFRDWQPRQHVGRPPLAPCLIDCVRSGECFLPRIWSALVP